MTTQKREIKPGDRVRAPNIVGKETKYEVVGIDERDQDYLIIQRDNTVMPPLAREDAERVGGARISMTLVCLSCSNRAPPHHSEGDECPVCHQDELKRRGQARTRESETHEPQERPIEDSPFTRGNS